MEGARPGWERKTVSLPRPTLPKRVKSALLDTLFLQTLSLLARLLMGSRCCGLSAMGSFSFPETPG